MRRRAGEMTRIPDEEEIRSKTPDVSMQEKRSAALGRAIRSINDITVNDISRISEDSPFAGGSDLFHELYNNGLSEEMKRIKINSKHKKPEEKDKFMFVLANYTIKPGSFVKIPELSDAGQYGVAQVADIVTKGRDPLHVPLAMLDFPDSQRPPGTPARCNNVAMAFLVKLSPDDAIEDRRAFEQEQARKQRSSKLSGNITTVRYGR